LLSGSVLTSPLSDKQSKSAPFKKSGSELVSRRHGVNDDVDDDDDEDQVQSSAAHMAIKRTLSNSMIDVCKEPGTQNEMIMYRAGSDCSLYNSQQTQLPKTVS
jgi:hypothetical protein